MDQDGNDETVRWIDLFDEDGRMRVNAERCGTCVAWPENRMDLAPGRKQQLFTDAGAADSFVACHQTLPYSHYDAPPAICHAYYRQYRKRVWQLRLALARGIITEVAPPCTTWASTTRKDRSMRDFDNIPPQQLYEKFIHSGALEGYRHWELVDDDDDPGDEWYVLVSLGLPGYPREERRPLDAARLWAAILACASGKIPSVSPAVVRQCEEINDADSEGTGIEYVRIDKATADAVMQVALLGQVNY